MEQVNKNLDPQLTDPSGSPVRLPEMRLPNDNAQEASAVQSGGTEGAGGTSSNNGDSTVSLISVREGTKGAVAALKPIADAVAGAKHVVAQVSVPNADRPCYRVYDEPTVLKESGRKLMPGVYLHERIPEKEGAISNFDIFICGPLYIEAQTADEPPRHSRRLVGVSHAAWAYSVICE